MGRGLSASASVRMSCGLAVGLRDFGRSSAPRWCVSNGKNRMSRLREREWRPYQAGLSSRRHHILKNSHDPCRMDGQVDAARPSANNHWRRSNDRAGGGLLTRGVVGTKLIASGVFATKSHSGRKRAGVGNNRRRKGRQDKAARQGQLHRPGRLTRPCRKAYPTKATESRMAWARISGPTRSKRTKNMANTVPMIVLPMKPPRPW